MLSKHYMRLERLPPCGGGVLAGESSKFSACIINPFQRFYIYLFPERYSIKFADKYSRIVNKWLRIFCSTSAAAAVT